MPKKSTEQPANLLPENQRPKCRNCGKPMKPVVFYDFVRVNTSDGFHTEMKNPQLSHYGYDRHQKFCTLRCGYKYALRCAAEKS